MRLGSVVHSGRPLNDSWVVLLLLWATISAQSELKRFPSRSQSGATLQTDVASTVKGGRKKVLIYFSDPRQVLKAVPVADRSVFVSKIAYSPLIGGYAIVLNDGRAAVLFASTPSFDPNVRKKVPEVEVG